MTRNTRTYSDLDLNFLAHPVTGDVSSKYDESAIKQSLKNLVMTNHYERLFHPEIGSQITNLLFEPYSPLVNAMLVQAIKNTINNHEPRVQLLGVEIAPNPDNNALYVSITFRIVNTSTPLRTVITLHRTR